MTVFDTRTRVRVYARGYSEIFVIKRGEKRLEEKFIKFLNFFCSRPWTFWQKCTCDSEEVKYDLDIAKEKYR